MEGLTSVRVELPIGSASFGLCVADIFEPDQLTITCTDEVYANEFGPMRVFEPSQWIEAVVYDERGNVLYAFVSELGEQREAERLAAARSALQRQVTRHAGRAASPAGSAL